MKRELMRREINKLEIIRVNYQDLINKNMWKKQLKEMNKIGLRKMELFNNGIKLNMKIMKE